MRGNIKALLFFLQDYNIDFVQYDKNFIEVKCGSKKLLFINCRVPFNDHSTSSLFTDKYFTYLFLKDHIKMPTTHFYLDPYIEKKFSRYRKFKDYQSIIDDINSHFTIPLVLKPNRLSRRRNFFLIDDSAKIEIAVRRIFDHKSKNYDYGMISQEFVNIKEEYRVIVIANEVKLVYKKWRFIKIHERNILDRIETVVQNITKFVDLNFVGIDIVKNKDEEIFLLEINSAPDFGPYIKHNNIQDIVEIYKFAFEKYVF
ncbi:MAG: hypothetical protein N3A71_00865 [Candidatus Dojkabacteria bacterium]|nr:hypothetical protein [Candidatus Dojkabacteria bacterium]